MRTAATLEERESVRKGWLYRDVGNDERQSAALILESTPDHPPAALGANRMTAAPARQIAAPVRSQVSGRCFSMSHSQRSEAAI